MSMFRAIDTAGSGMTAERLRIDVISNNLANVNTTRTEKGGSYRRQLVVFQSKDSQEEFANVLEKSIYKNVGPVGGGVRAVQIVEDQSPLKTVYDPHHPDADNQGYVRLPNVNVVAEMVDMMTASRAYEANVASITASKTMAMRALEIGK